VPPSPANSTLGVDAQGDALRQVLMLTDQAEQQLEAGRVDEAVQTARRAKNLGLNQGRTWHVFARALEAQGDFAAASTAYDRALETKVPVGALSGGMARVALRLGDYAKAEGLLTAHLELAPATAEIVADLALAQTRLMAFDRAHETLKTALEAAPGEPLLWLTLAQLLCVQGRHAQAVVFFEESLRLDPGSALAQAGLADALLLGAGDVERALAVSEEALAAASPAILPAMTDAHARRLLAAGRLAEGWAAFASGVGLGAAALVEVRVAAPRWTPGAPPGGGLLLIGEDSVFDELVLAQALPDIIAGGPRLVLAIDPSWETLARRSFPSVAVAPLLSRDEGGKRLQAAGLDSPHVHGGELIGAWAPLRAMMSARRGQPADFTDTGPYLKTDLRRVRYWQGRLAALGPGPKVGVLWRSRADARTWEAPPLGALAAALSVPGLHLISLQQEEVVGELAWVDETFGLQIYPPPTELSREHLDDLASLAQALDVVVGPPDVATGLAAACGAETWFLSTPHHWAMLGAETFPWFPRARVIAASGPDDWSGAMTELGEALTALVAASAQT